MKPLKKMFRSLLELNEPPEHTARSFAVGVFLGFSPLLGLHTVLGLALAFGFRLNKVAVLLGVYSNVPWIIAPYYACSTLLGTLILGAPGIELPSDIGFGQIFSAQFWQWLAGQWKLLIPAFVGSTLLCTLLGGLAYAGMLGILRRFRVPFVPGPDPAGSTSQID